MFYNCYEMKVAKFDFLKQLKQLRVFEQMNGAPVTLHINEQIQKFRFTNIECHASDPTHKQTNTKIRVYEQ